MTINSILKNHKSIRTWFIVTIVLGSVSLLGLLFVGVWGIFNGMADLCWLFFIVGFFIAINAVGVCIALLGFAVTIDKAKLAEVGADVIQTAAVENIEKKDIDTISHRLSKLFELKENGVITEEEFAEQKKIILGE
uniref:SHOCT domain-containing protein n=1 Tax=Candidatus Fimenecus sp. TaxID=3022888 RepID=UPI0040258EBF